jgi:class 3 adenylate cyclase/tetratricopeptide (TPR) repeat protein
MPTPAPAPAERRALTVMFCDLVGSTALSAQLDPEDLRDLLAAYQRHATAIVEAAGGRVARYEGDGILAYFGYPAASENDAELAAGAGLELADGIPIGKVAFGGLPGEAAAGAAGEKLNVRIGIATGVVVVGELLPSSVADNPPVVGETPNLAARLQELAEPGAVVIDEGTRRLTGGLFEYRDGGAVRLNGFTQPVQIWRVMRASAASRFTALRSQSLPLLGREAAMAGLMEQWALARQGVGRVALVSGEAGIGKSRLVLELARQAGRDHATILRFQCSPRHESSMLHPVLERLQRAVRLHGADDPPAAKLERLKRLLHGQVQVANGAVALLADLMSLPAPAVAPGAGGDRLRQRDLLFESLTGALERLAAGRPVLLVLEDAHWIDPTSLQLLDLVVARVPGWAVLVVVTGRAEFEPAWRSAPHVARIELPPIATADAEALVRRVPGGETLPEAVVRGIAARADGVPLYVEELTRAVLESAASGGQIEGPSAPVIPTGLHASLTARLDRIGPTREVAKIAAALGREFSFDLLSAVVPDRDPAGLRRDLQRLVEAGLTVPVASPPSEAYAFRHALIQDAAYATLLRSERRALHGRIAEAIQQRFPKIGAGQPEIVADHCAKAQLWEPAARFRLSAGRRALRAWALTEAAHHFSEGLRLVERLPQSPVRRRLELDLLMALGEAMMGSSGYASQQSLQVYRRAEPMVRAIGDLSERLVMTLDLFNVHYGRAELAEALALAEEYCALAERHQTNLGRAYGLLAQTHSAMGALPEAAREFRRSLDVFARTPEDVAGLGVFGSQHVISLALGAGVQFALGEPEAGAVSIAQSVALAREMEHVLSIALALVSELLTPIPGGLNPDLARAEEAARYCAQHRLQNFEAWAEFARGAILARRGDARAGIGAMRAAVDATEAMNSRLFRPIQLGTLASAHARLGETEAALSLIDEALETAAKTGERRADVSLHRLRGELLFALGKRSQSDAALRQALEVAHQQRARAEEARVEKTIARFAGARLPMRRFQPLAALRSLLALKR